MHMITHVSVAFKSIRRMLRAELVELPPIPSEGHGVVCFVDGEPLGERRLPRADGGGQEVPKGLLPLLRVDREFALCGLQSLAEQEDVIRPEDA